MAAMSELDEAWALALAAAEQKARAAGRGDISEYLRLRNSNDLLRRTSIDWLFQTFTVFAGEANRKGASLQIAHADPHRFRVGNSTMVGQQLTLILGVRSLSVEAGWPRVPTDGIIRGGGLACAHVIHRGKKTLNQTLRLERARSSDPVWLITDELKSRTRFLESHVRDHLSKLLSEQYR